MFIIYTKERIPKKVFTVNLSEEEVKNVLDGDVFVDHKDLKEDDYIVVQHEKPFEHPISTDLETVREMTRLEKLEILNMTEVLTEGEVYQDGEIKKVEVPSCMIRPVWNNESKKWKESMTREELLIKRKDKIIKYIDIKSEIEKIKDIEFESTETVEILEHQLQKLKSEINELAEYVKHLKGDDTHEN